MQDFSRLWQLPLIAAFVVIWLTGGTYLARRALMKFAGLPPRHASLGRALGMNFLCQGAAMVALAIVTVALIRIGRQFEAPVLYFLGPLLGAAAMLVTSYVVHWAAVEIPGTKLVGMVVTTSGPLLALAAVFALLILLPVRAEHQAGRKMGECWNNLIRINDAFEQYASRNSGLLPASLKLLVDEGYLKSQETVCPGSERLDSYLYAPLAVPNQDSTARQIRLADRKGNHGDYRLVLFQNSPRGMSYIERLSEEKFQKLSLEPQNSHILPLVEKEK